MKERSFAPYLFYGAGGFVLGLALWVLFFSDQPPQPPKPVLVFSPETVQFGSVPQGIERGRAVVTNVSTKSVEIKAVVKGCDCAEVRIAKGTLQSGEEREITFQWDTHGRRGDNAISIGVIYTLEDDPTDRAIPLIIEATVIPDFEISPKRLEFFSNRQSAHQFTLSPARDFSVEIKDVIIHDPAFSTDVSSDGQSATVSFDPDKWTDGVRYMNAQVVTTSERESVFLLPISIQVVSASDSAHP